MVLCPASRRNGHDAIVRYRSKASVDPNATNDAGVTPLILACETGHTTVLLQLVAAGAHVNRSTQKGSRHCLPRAISVTQKLCTRCSRQAQNTSL